jgi:hypothetical protein
MRKVTVIATAALAILVVSAVSAFAAPGIQSSARDIAAYHCGKCGHPATAVAHGMEAPMPVAVEADGHHDHGWAGHLGCGCGDQCGCERDCGCNLCCERCCCPRHFDPPIVCFHDHEDLHRDLVSRWHAPWQQTIAWLN